MELQWSRRRGGPFRWLPWRGRPLVETIYLLRWVLPIVIFIVVVLHQVIQVLIIDQFNGWVRLTSGILAYGLLGPIVTWRMLDWIGRNLTKQQAAEEEIRRLNRDLEAKVAQRTAELAQAYEELQARNQELKAANAELRELDRLKSEFVSMVSHELRAPLTNINGSVELLLQAPDLRDASSRQLLGIIGDQSARLTRLVRGILNVSRIEAGKLKLSRKAVDLAGLIQKVVSNCVPPSTTHPVQLAIAADLPAVRADADRVEEILLNLIDNAIKYSPEGGAITISAAPGPDQRDVTVTVADHGIGIPQRQLTRIFEKFYRLDQRDARETYGYGLGLYISKRLIEAHGGRIWAESQEGVGSTFRFSLPTVRRKT